MHDYSQALLLTKKLSEIIPNEFNNESKQLLNILNNEVTLAN